MQYQTVDYRPTIRACFTGYIVQAVVNNFAPLLFLTFQAQYGIPLSQVTLLITVNFLLQLLVDCASVFFIDRIGYRASALLAHGFSALGLILLAILPQALPSVFAGLLIAVFCYALGGGLLEVIISPLVEACPSDRKAQTMSMLHSFYCWGSAGVVLLSTLFLAVFGRGSWRVLAVIWALLPIANGLIFTKVPIATLISEGERGLTLRELFSLKTFWILMVLMLCAGASEQAVSQWASTFVERGLGVTKALGDLTGPTVFSLLMGLSRAFYGKRGDRLNLEKLMLLSAGLCVAAYLIIGLTSRPVAGLFGVALAGLSVGLAWPGTFSRAAVAIPKGGTAMFALFALAGDLGCSSGPTLAGAVAGALGENLRLGILSGVVFPILMIVFLLLLSRSLKGQTNRLN